LGDGTTVSRSTPVQVTGLTGVAAIAGGNHYSLALKNDGTVWAWGSNTSGQLGDGTTTNRFTPVQVANLTGVTLITAGGWAHCLALTDDGTVWAWGGNSYGQLGDGTTTDRTTPVQVPGLTGVTAIAAGTYHSLFLGLPLPTAPSGSMAGTVRTPTGTPVPGATVSCGNYQTITNSSGTYALTAIPVGTYTARSSKLYYARQNVSDVIIAQDQTTPVDFVIAPTAPSPVTNLAVLGDKESNVLTWTHSVSGNSVATMIRFKTTGFPTGPNDGELVVDQGGLPEAVGTFTHSGLTNGLFYYYAAFAHDEVGTFSTAVTAGPVRPKLLRADFDGDEDVDQEDFGLLQRCLTGSLVPITAPECQTTNLDRDLDVDQLDVSKFFLCYSGPGIVGNPDCED
jgi:hypothetical protein